MAMQDKGGIIKGYKVLAFFSRGVSSNGLQQDYE